MRASFTRHRTAAGDYIREAGEALHKLYQLAHDDNTLLHRLGSVVFVEYIFDWKGMGVVILDGLDKYDFPVVMGSLLYVSIILVIINIICDIIYGWLDPRVSLT